MSTRDRLKLKLTIRKAEKEELFREINLTFEEAMFCQYEECGKKLVAKCTQCFKDGRFYCQPKCCLLGMSSEKKE